MTSGAPSSVIHDGSVAIGGRSYSRRVVQSDTCGWQGRCSTLGPVKLLLLIPLAGCFYVESFNQRPAVQIVNTADQVERGDVVLLRAEADDPDGQGIQFGWRVNLCTDADDFATCDRDPVITGIEDELVFTVPNQRANGLPVESLHVVLEAEDDHGATAKPEDRLSIPVGNATPEVELREASRYRFVVDTPIDLYAAYGDADDTAANVTLAWEVQPPNVTAYELVDLGPDVVDPDNAARLLDSRSLTPAIAGKWIIKITATDPLGLSHTEDLEIMVVPDHVPCLDQWSPSAPVTATLPVSEPTLFQIPIVGDDLDRYPTIPNDPIYGQTRFAWSIKVGTGPRQAMGVTANSVPFDPAGYAPETVVELRVEIFDRNDTPIACSDGDRTCSVIADPGCIQRQTWHVEVR